MASTSITEVIGLDLGHGETAVARAVLGSREPPTMLEIFGRKSLITALAHDMNGNTLIGEKAVRAPDALDLEIHFKRSPSRDPRLLHLREFVSRLYQELIRTGQIERSEKSWFFVGHPSGWEPKDREAYSQILANCGIPHLTVVPESRAALVNARESGRVTARELKNEYILVIDVGSSTTDFTLVKGLLEEPIGDFGYNLGGSHIDTAIFERTLANHPQREELEKIFVKHPRLRELAILTSRKSKEEYFRDPELYEKEPVPVTGDIQKYVFRPSVNGSIMEEILKQPLSSLDERSWCQYFYEVVNKVKTDLAQYKPGVVLTTGGASRMEFIQEICQEAFPETAYRWVLNVN